MYNCLDCGAEFETPVLEDMQGDDYEVCPSCGSDDIVEVDDENDDSVYDYEYPDDDPADLAGDDL